MAIIATTDAILEPRGSQSITVTSTAATLASLCSGGALPSNVVWAWIQPRGGDIYMTDLSTDTPTTGGVGLKITQDQMFPIGAPLNGVKLVAASSVAVTVQFYA